MIIKKKIKIPIFFYEIMVVLTDNLQDYAKTLGYKVDENYAAFVVSEDSSLSFAVFDVNELSLSILVHETVHIVNAIFKYTGIELDVNNDETQAYLTGFIFNELLNVIKKHEHNLSIL